MLAAAVAIGAYGRPLSRKGQLIVGVSYICGKKCPTPGTGSVPSAIETKAEVSGLVQVCLSSDKSSTLSWKPLCVQGDQDLEELQGSVYELGVFEDVYRIQKTKKVSVDAAFSKIVRELQPSLRGLLAWIADPNRLSREERQTTLSFLVQHGTQEAATCDFDPTDEFDETGNVGVPLFYWKYAWSFETVIAPVAKFIFERIEQYHHNELSLDEAMPIVLCKREGCGMFSVHQRKTKDFCSDSCRTLHRQKEKPEEHAAYMRQYRKNNYTKPIPTHKRK